MFKRANKDEARLIEQEYVKRWYSALYDLAMHGDSEADRILAKKALRFPPYDKG